MKTLRMTFLAAVTALALEAQWGGELRFCLHSDPRTFNPVLVEDSSSETVRYLTGGVLLRVNRATQQLEPELAERWRVEDGGRRIVFQLKEGVLFSDGTPFTAEDVAYTMRQLLDPAVHSPTGDAFRPASGTVGTAVRGKYEIAVTFPQPVAAVARLFDQAAILSQHSPLKERAVLGPFQVAQYKAGSFVLLSRNPNYWKMAGGRRLPYLDSIRLEILQSREAELLRFRRGELHMISQLDAEQFDTLAAEDRGSVRDAGPTLEGELMWFNMNPAAPIPAFRKAWFRSRNFRLAVSHAIRRDDLARVVYHGHAQPGIGPFSPANQFWFNRNLRPHAFDLEAARRLLAEEGFRSNGRTLLDREGHPVEFSLATNAGNRSRERIAAMLQQDLAALGMKVNIVTLDFPSLIERIGKTFQYEACLLGLVNVDLDPNEQMNVWVSSASNHQWNPGQKTPQTAWEAEIDRLMRQQAAATNEERRKALFDRVQQVVSEQAPFLYLVNQNALVAISRHVHNASPAVLRPQAIWNVEQLWLDKNLQAAK
ncbi:MAG TPA: ABC transporter substrate-binding protein [Candidatus Sulfopaludibacter sp.]|nr:ABC transporter substrate-binding protein [Candidatus Sulfopaludibacter sp.]